ncbi:hypothetical protein DdX_03459 [Ditylenchus destructor]|uniref:FLYWCH-type domain-containing protein n=1 Tax=Ditylenchus destructor TaxID=166010 RepID=A0AAD4NCI3_9BILA|nr:hypothetical protein DdX_03459 [Ditylenchus destructor]
MENRNFEYLDTERGKRMLKDSNGYLYWKNKQKRDAQGATRTYWICIFWEQGPNGEKESTCNGCGVVCDDIFTLSRNRTHNNESYEDAAVLKEFEGRIRQMAKDNTDASARTVFTRGIAVQMEETPNYVLAEIEDERVQRNIRNYRKKVLQEPPIPASIDELIIQEPYIRYQNEVN